MQGRVNLIIERSVDLGFVEGDVSNEQGYLSSPENFQKLILQFIDEK